MPNLKKVVAVDVRPGEWARLLPLVLAYALLMASLYVLKPARNALFLDAMGAAQLPYVLLLVALVGGIAAVLFARISRWARPDLLVPGTFLVLIASLLAFWLLLPHASTWGVYSFYIFVNLYGLMSTSLLWLMANAAFNPREARRLFGIVGTGGIAGAIAGSAFTSWIVGVVGTENLVPICALLLTISLLLLRLVRSAAVEDGKKEGSTQTASPLKMIAASDLLRLLAGMGGVGGDVAAVADVQFNAIVELAYPDKDAKTAFFGQFFAVLNIFAILFQMLITPRILRSLGVIPALLFLPLSMAAGSLAVLLTPALWAGIAVKIGDGGFRHSIHKSATEILFLPVPAEIKRRTKVLLDATVDNLATGLGALLVLLLTTVVGVSFQQLSYLSFFFVAAWLVLVLFSRSAYIDAFRRALDRREIDEGELTVDLNEAAALDSVAASLKGGSERQIAYALDVLGTVSARRLVEPVSLLLLHESAEVRRRALTVLQNQTGPIDLARVEELVDEEDLEESVEAFYCLYRHHDGDTAAWLRAALAMEKRTWRKAAVGYIVEYGTAEERDLLDANYMRSLFDSSWQGSVKERLGAARILGRLRQPELGDYLHELARELMNDSDRQVVRQTIESLGTLAAPEHVPWLVARLADRDYRHAARQALAACGEVALPNLSKYLLDDEFDLGQRLAIARVLGQIHRQEVVDLLLGQLGRSVPLLDVALIKSLSKLRNAGLSFDRSEVERHFDKALELYFNVLQLQVVYAGDDGGAELHLLRRVLGEKRQETLEGLFRLLGLLYDPDDMYRAYLGLVSKGASQRASALEFLDNVLERAVKERLLPLLDYASVEAAVAQERSLYKRQLNNRFEALGYLLQAHDDWVRACAAFSTGRDALVLLEPLLGDPRAMVREAAVLALARAH
jgi:ATP:ADP antiporter, AAA family